MNKYIKYYNNIEKKSLEKKHLKLKLLMLKLKKEMIKYFSFEDIKIIYYTDYESLLKTTLIGLSQLDEKLQNYVINNIINKLNKESIINLYLMFLCNAQTSNDNDAINEIIDSFKKSGLIKDINLNEEENIFTLTNLEDKKIKFKCRNNSQKQIEEANGMCHGVTSFILKQNKYKKMYAVTILMNNLVGEKQYHTFFVYNNIVHDFAHNIIMSFDNYKLLYKPDIISFESASKIYKDIEKLKKKDSDFDNNYCELLNYAIHKQLRKETKKSNKK